MSAINKLTVEYCEHAYPRHSNCPECRLLELESELAALRAEINTQSDRADNMQADRNHYRDEEEKTAIENAALRAENAAYRTIAGELGKQLAKAALILDYAPGLSVSTLTMHTTLARYNEIEKGKK